MGKYAKLIDWKPNNSLAPNLRNDRGTRARSGSLACSRFPAINAIVFRRFAANEEISGNGRRSFKVSSMNNEGRTSN